MSNSNAIGWTPARIERLTKMWDDGKSGNVIGAAIGVSKNAVLGKAHRLGLKPHLVLDPKTVAKRLVNREAKNASLLAPAPTTCRFPLWPDAAPRPTMEFCQAPREDGSSYCTEHRAICTRRVMLHEIYMPKRAWR